MASEPAQKKLLRSWQIWTGTLFILLAVAGFVWVSRTPRAAFSEKIQLGIALAIVAGAVTLLNGMLSSGKINKEWFDRITIWLAVAAIVFAVWQFHDARGQEFRMEGLAEQMSTRFVGFFPKNMHDVDEVVSHADKSLDIMTDYVGYGHYSAPEDFERYLRTLQDLRIKGVTIRMIVYSQPQALSRYETQFTDDDFKEQIGLATSKNKHPIGPSEKMVAFCKKFNYDFCKDFNQRSGVLRKEDFERLVFHKQLDYMEDLIERGVEIKETGEASGKQPLPFFLWCEDRHEAIFSFLNDEKDTDAPREVSFRTRDSRLVEDTLERRFDEMWNNKVNRDVTLAVVKQSRRPSWDEGFPQAAPATTSVPKP
jgi:hypothetical protein